MSPKRPSDRTMMVHVGQPSANQKIEKGLPLGIFSSEWFSKTDEQKLDEYISRAKKNTLDKFFGHFSEVYAVPSAEELQNASGTLGRRLNEELLRNELFEILNGNERVELKEANYLISHLNALMPPLKLPNPINVQYDLPRTALAVIAAIGAVLGFIFGGGIVGFIGNAPPETGHLFGAVAGAALLSFAALSITNNPELQKWLQIGAGVAGAVDTGISGDVPMKRSVIAAVKKLRKTVIVTGQFSSRTLPIAAMRGSVRLSALRQRQV